MTNTRHDQEVARMMFNLRKRKTFEMTLSFILRMILFLVFGILPEFILRKAYMQH